MKIGVLTLPFNNNYGGYLQAYALMTYLKEMGHNPILLNRRPNIDIFHHYLTCCKYNIKQIIRGRKPDYHLDPEYIFHKQGELMFDFVDKHIYPKTRPIYSSKSLYKEIKKRNLDFVIIGSDQVWRSDYVPSINDYFLSDTVSKINVFSYAASFGTETPQFKEEEIKTIRDSIFHFNAVSVRERSGKNIIYEIKCNLHDTPQIVLDPTFLFSATHYCSLLPKQTSKTKDNIFCYILDCNQKIYEILSEVSAIQNKKIYCISDIQEVKKILPSVQTWLSAIRDANAVITDSYHGTVFSIIYRKTFVSLPNKGRGADRIIDLLSRLGLESQIAENLDEIQDKLSNEIDWHSVEKKLDREIACSKDFIEKNLHSETSILRYK